MGEVRIHGDGRHVRLARSGERCVLATLALTPGRPVLATTLADHIWSATTQSDKALSTVADYVRKVRAAIKSVGGRAEWLRTNRATHAYVLDIDPRHVDYFRFADLVSAARGSAVRRSEEVELLRAALALWRGPALADVRGIWADNRRYELETERLKLHEKILEDQLRTGDYLDVVRIATMLIDDTTPTDKLLLLGAQGLAGAGHRNAIPGWLDRARRRMRAVTGAEPSATVLARIGALVSEERIPRAVVTHKAMFTLPQNIVGFTGRQDELRDLASTVDHVAGHVISGMAGVGKSAFSVHAAHQMKDRYPDGQLFIELHGHAPRRQPVKATDVLASLVLASGVHPTLIPLDQDDRARMWRDRTSAKKVLVVLDDVVEHDQVRPLLPGSSDSHVLVTSRQRLPVLSGVQPVFLEALTSNQAVQMLHRLAGLDMTSQDRAATQRITELCGRLPLAIALAAGQLQAHPRWTPSYLADQIDRAADRLDCFRVGDRSVATAFDQSFRRLSIEQKCLFTLLGMHAASELDADAVANLEGWSPEQASKNLEHLYTVHLVRETSPGRYKLLPGLLQDYARSRAVRVP